MSPMPPDAEDLRSALRIRLEADQLLGARVLPIRPPAPRSAVPARAPAVAPAHSSAPPPRPASSPPAAPPPKPIPAPAPADPAVAAARTASLHTLDVEKVRNCTRCGLHQARTRTVFGQGSPTARVVFVGEAPGAEEDRTGLAFVGRAGELLTAMIEKGMGLKRDDAYICNVIKCRPPDNRTPAPDEITQCVPYLWEQLSTINPEVIVALGGPAAQTLLNTREGITRLRGRWHQVHVSGSPLIGPPTPCMPTFHPAYLLRSPGEKVKAWEDLKLILARLNLPLPSARPR
ncbi:MAG: uracil-DNA glycosylase [Phycisphaerae bacterium]